MELGEEAYPTGGDVMMIGCEVCLRKLKIMRNNSKFGRIQWVLWK